VIEDIFKRLPQCEMQGMYIEPDGAFPNHEANPLKEETLHDLRDAVVDGHADLGVAFDGDGDRIGLVDEKGNIVRGDIIMALIAPAFLGPKGGLVLYDVRSSWAVPEAIAHAGGTSEMCPVGHGLIKPLMREKGATFAGELSNHFYFRDFYGAESSDLVMLTVMALMTKTGKPLSELVAPLMRYHHSGEINFHVADARLKMTQVHATYAGQATSISTIDGVRMEFKDASAPEGDWWFSIRSSNTEPLLRLNLEARDRGVMEAKKAELEAVLRA
jgi:phosphomannomutase